MVTPAAKRQAVAHLVEGHGMSEWLRAELLSSLVFEGFGSCGDLAGFGSFNSVFERNACDDFSEVVKAA